jgi:hypothetical protein
MTTERVTFDSSGARLVGTLFLPADRRERRLPAVVVTGSWLTVKEQMPAVYAPRVAEAGLVALTFDFTGFGESAGEPREVESPARKAADFSAAVRFLASRPEVDPGRIGVLAICASAGYAAVASTRDPGLRSIAMVAPWLHDAGIAEAIYGGAEGVARRRQAAREARDRFERTGEVQYVKAASSSDPTAAMYWEGDALDYYLNPRRGRLPQWGGRFAVMAWEEWLAFDPIAIADRVSVPVRIVTGPQTATPGGAARFAERLAGPHDVVSQTGTQFDFYDDAATVARASAAAIEHLRTTLATAGAPAPDADGVRRTVTRLLHAIDGRRWDELTPLLADEVRTDYTSLFGGEVQRQDGPALADTWRKLLSPLEATQHLLGPIDVELRGDVAAAETHVRGYHFAPIAKGGREWMIAGHYVMELVWRGGAWRIAGITLQTYYQTGNERLLEEAAEAGVETIPGSGTAPGLESSYPGSV